MTHRKKKSKTMSLHPPVQSSPAGAEQSTSSPTPGRKHVDIWQRDNIKHTSDRKKRM